MRPLAFVFVLVMGCTPPASRPSGRSPTSPSAGRSAHRIAAGEGHTCVVMPSGAVACWGRDALSGPKTVSPVMLPGIVARSLFAAGTVTCARTAQGLRCLGDNLFGQLHLPPSLEYESPAVSSPEWGAAEDGVLGPQGACTLGAHVTCWGEVASSMTPSEDTRFGFITKSEQAASPVTGARVVGPHVVPGIDGAVQVAMGVAHLCALMPDGTVRCLGENTVGQLGRVTPTLDGYFPATTVEGLRDVVQLEAGLATTCARTAKGEVLCWGSNYFGHLAAADESKLVPHRQYVTIPNDHPHDFFWPVPRRVEGLPPIAQLSVGASHVCAITEVGTVLCWGSNDAGQLGDGSVTRRDVPTAMLGVEHAVDVAASTYGPKSHTCVLLQSGHVRCAGRNGHGELGGAPSEKNEPIALEVPGL